MKYFVNKQSTTDKVVPSIFIDKGINSLEKGVEEMSMLGKKEGRQGLPEHTIFGLSLAEKQWQARCQGVLEEVRSFLNPKIASLSQTLDITKEKLKGIEVKSVEDCLDSLALEKAAEQAKIAVQYESKSTPLQEDLDQESLLIKEVRANLYEMKDQIGFTPVKRWYDTFVGYFFILFVFSVFEIPLNFTAALQMGVPNALALLATIGITLYLIVTAHLLGDSLAQKNTFQIYASSLMAILMIGAIISFRGIEEYSLAAVNIVVLLAGCIYAKKRSLFRHYFLIERRFKKLGQRKKSLQILLKETEVNQASAQKELDNEIAKRADNLAYGEQRILRNKVEVQNLELENLQSTRQQTEKRIDGLFKEGILAFRVSNEEQRQLFEHELRQVDDPPSLLFAKVKFPLIPAMTNKPNSLNGIKKKSSILFFFLGLFSLTSCDFKLEAPSATELTVIFDETLHSELGDRAEEITHFIFEQIMGFDSSVTSNSATVHISTIGEVSLQQTQTIHLPPGKSYWLREEKKRRRVITNFRNQLVDAFRLAIPSIKPTHHSRVNRNLCQHLPTLITSSADKKVLLIFSDLIQNSNTISFYKYRKNPEALQQDYPAIAEKLQQDCPFGPLNGIEIIVVHLPDKKDDELFTASKKFWIQYFQDQGAQEITFVANL